MKVHQTDELFGLDAFSGPLETGRNTLEIVSGEQESGENEIPKKPLFCLDLWAHPLRKMIFRELLCRKILLGMVFTILLATVGLSLFTLTMKTKRKAVSYELSYQTRLFRRMSKHRAIYELEYAYQRENHPLIFNHEEKGWRKITPHDLTYIPMKRRELPSGRGMTWQP